MLGLTVTGRISRLTVAGRSAAGKLRRTVRQKGECKIRIVPNVRVSTFSFSETHQIRVLNCFVRPKRGTVRSLYRPVVRQERGLSFRVIRELVSTNCDVA